MYEDEDEAQDENQEGMHESDSSGSYTESMAPVGADGDHGGESSKGLAGTDEPEAEGEPAAGDEIEC
jgi:hypothetical protein